MNKYNYLRFFKVLVLSMALPSVGAAQSDNDEEANDVRLEEIIVTARFREESIQDIGVAVTAFDESMLQQEGITDFADFARLTAGLDFVDRGPNRNTPSIRGLSRLTILTDIISSPALIGNYIDDIPTNSPGNNQRDVRTFDVNRIEVLRGPQGSLFGEASAGGTIRTFFNEPDLQNFGFKTELTLAQTRHADDIDVRVNFGVNVPLIEDKLGVRAVVYNRDDHGFIDNVNTGEADTNSFEAKGGRIILTAKPNDRFEARLAYMRDDNDIGADWIVFSPNGESISDYTIDRPGPDVRIDDAELTTLKLSYDFDKLSVQSITGRYERTFDRDFFDSIQTNNVIRGLVAPVVFAANGDASLFGGIALGFNRMETDNFSQELRFISDFEGRFNFVAGLFYHDKEFVQPSGATVDAFIPISGENTYFSGTSVLTGEQKAIYGEAAFDLSERFRLIAGGRYFEDELNTSARDGVLGVDFTALFTNFALINAGFLPPDSIYDSFGNFPAPDESTDNEITAFLPKVVLEYRPSDDSLLFLSGSQGARNGGQNSTASAESVIFLDPNTGLVDPAATAAAQQAALTYDEDKVTTFELGAKTAWADNRFILNASAYFSDWEDIQTTFFAANNFAYFANAGEAEISGLEVESSFAVNDNWTLFANANTNSSELKKTTIISNVEIDGGIPVLRDPPRALNEGDKVPGVPGFTGSAGINFQSKPWNNGMSFSAGLTLSHVGETTYRVDNQDRKSKAYTLANLRAGISGERWGLSLFANNVTDEEVVLSRVGSADITEAELYILRPRQIGLTFRYDY